MRNYNQNVLMKRVVGVPAGNTFTKVPFNIEAIDDTSYLPMAYGNGYYVVPGTNPSNSDQWMALYSSDGVEWETSNPVTDSRTLAGSMPSETLFLNDRFLFISGSTAVSAFYHSVDMINWTEVIINTGTGYKLTSVTYGDGKWVAVSQYSPSKVQIAHSTDLVNWTIQADVPAMTGTAHVTFGNGVFSLLVNGGSAGGYIVTPWTSTNGTSWTSNPTIDTLGLTLIATFNDGYFFTYFNTDNNIYKSVDGVSWETLPLPEELADIDLIGIRYGHGRYWIHHDDYETEPPVYHSEDGSEWTAVSGINEAIINLFTHEHSIKIFGVGAEWADPTYVYTSDAIIEVLSGNEFFSIPKGYSYMSAINASDNTIYIYQERNSNPNTDYSLIKLYPYTQRTIPINETQDQFTVSWFDGGLSGSKKVEMIFSKDNLQLNGALGGVANSDVTVVGDTLGLTKQSQLPSELNSDRLKVIVTNLTSEPVYSSVTALPALPAGTNNIGDVDVLTLPTLPVGNNKIGKVQLISSTNDEPVASISGDNNSGIAILTSGGYLYNGSTFDRERNNTDIGLLASSARTASIDTPSQTNHNSKGVLVTLNVTGNPAGAETLSLQLKSIDLVSGVPATIADSGVIITASNGIRTFLIYPASIETIANSELFVQGIPIPRIWMVTVTHSGAGSWTYSLSASLIN